MIQFEDLSIRRGENMLFDGASFQVHPGQKVGLTGANGCGKSSLFSALLGDLTLDKGDVKIPKDWVIAHVAQEAPSDDKGAIEHVLDGDAEWRDLYEKIQDIDHPQYLKHHTHYEEIDGYSARARAAQLLNGLGFNSNDINKAAKTFSGGWRVRLNVAKALMCRSDLLLLDEPTNHLDLDAVLWLERWLRSYVGTLLVIAHDRDFLDGLTTHTLHIEHSKAQLHKGNYSAFEKIRAEQLSNQQSAFEKQQKQIEHMQDFVRRFKAKATKAKQAQSRLKALQRMEVISAAHVDSPFTFSIPDPHKNPSPLLSVHDASIAYGEKVIVEHIDFAMTPGDRVGLIGPNGAGKSTLIKMLAGEIKLSSGNFHSAKDINIGYFAQHQIEQLRMQESPYEHLKLIDIQTNNGHATENQLRRYLGSFGFIGNKATSKVKPFSGGEKSRLALALICYQKPNLLLLDEPTNHLDLEMRQALAIALQNFTGAVVLVSHDRHLLKVNSDKLLLVAHGRASEFQGSVDDYPKWLAAHNKKSKLAEFEDSDKAEKNVAKNNAKANQNTLKNNLPKRTSPKNNSPINNSAAGKKEQKRLEAEKRKTLQPLRDKVKRAERVMEKLNTEKSLIQEKLSDANTYNDEHKDTFQQLLTDQAYIQKELDQAESDWMEASEALEKTQSL